MNREIPGILLNFTQPIIDTVTETVTGSSADLAVVIRGPDLGELRQLADKTLAMVRTIHGSADASIEQEEDQPGLRILVDRSRIARYGLNVDDLTRVIESALGGAAIGRYSRGTGDLTLRYDMRRSGAAILERSRNF